MSIAWSSCFSDRANSAKSSMIRELLRVTQQSDVISFAGGLPAGDLFPTERVQEACHTVLENSATLALQYGETEGYRPLREMIARHIVRYGIKASAENILITTGSQQALDLIGKLLINPGDRVLVEAPTYLGALQAFSMYGPEFLSVPTDEDGLRVNLLEGPLRSGPKFLYVLPNFQNPGGTTLSEYRRRALVQLAERFRVPIVEDDPYGQLRYEGEHLSPLVVLDRVTLPREEDFKLGNVIYLSTFSKTLSPGLRLGWVVAPPDVIAKLAQMKQGADLHTSTFTQMLAYEVAREGFLDEHVKKLRVAYRQRRDVMLDALASEMPPGVTWTRPKGGLFLWVTLPEGMEASELFREALDRKVAFVPGECFFAPDWPGSEAKRHLRLNFSNAKPERIREGVRRLSLAVKAQIRELHPV